MSAESLVNRIDAILPQTQCQRCGYADCYAYAQALASDSAELNQCPPGGDATIAALADLLHRPAKPLNPAHGIHGPRRAAVIDEARCIGCTRCILVCPVDAILGATKLMHSVIAQECTGCELCIPACPVDCIVMVPAPHESSADQQARAELGRRRHHFRVERLARDRAERSRRQASQITSGTSIQLQLDTRRAAIRAAVERARAKHKSSAK